MTPSLDELKREYERLQQRHDEAIRHLKFTTHAAEYVYQPKKDLMPGWDPTFYHTLTYEGDLDLINRTKAAREFLSKDGMDKFLKEIEE